jgi:hypothetical protein
MKLDRRQFLTASFSSLAMALASRSSSAGGNGRPPKNVIVLACFGGWDAASVLDPKKPSDDISLMPGEEAEAGNIRYRSLATKDTIYEKAGDQVDAFFQEYYDRTVLLRGIDVGSLAHAACRVRILTGTDDATLPDFAAIAANEIGYDRPLPYVDLGGNGYMGPLGRIVGRFGVDSQIAALVDPEAYPLYAPIDKPLYVPGDADQDAIANYVLGRAQDQLGGRAKLGYNNDRVRDYIESHARASQLYGHRAQLPHTIEFTELTDQVALAPKLLVGDSGALCQTIFLDSRLPWDTHFDNDNLQLLSYQTAFGAIRDLLAGIEEAGGPKLLDDTLIVVLSEMGRTPLQNTANPPGKDHWPTTTALLIGGGIQGNRIIGGTDSIMNARPLNFDTGLPDDANGRLVTSADFIATILDYVGVVHSDWSDGEVIRALANG